ncbi:MAG: ArnT family glycosyltransferase [Candidatus Hodarchaeota archaeon]
MSNILKSFQDLAPSDLILVYFVLMNFILVVPSILIGLSSKGMVFYYQFYVILIALSILLLATKRLRTFLYSFAGSVMKPKRKILLLLVGLLWCVYIILIILYTTIFRNFDAIAVYLPMAKAIQMTGALNYNPLFISEAQMAHPPLFPILYSFTMSTVGISFVKIVPVIYLLFLMLAIYRLGSNFFGKNAAILSVFIVLVMPNIHAYFGSCSLYLDLGYYFYSLVSLLFLFKCHKDKKNQKFWCLLLGISSGLLFLSKEYGSFMFFVIFSLFIFNFLKVIRNSYVKTFLAAVVAFFPYLFLSSWHTIIPLINSVNVQAYYYFMGLFVLVFFVAFSYFFVFLNRRLPKKPVGSRLLKLALFILPVAFSVTHTGYNFIVNGQVLTWKFRISSELNAAGVVNPTSATLDVMRWNPFDVIHFFISFPTVLFLIPFLIGLVRFISDIRKGKTAQEGAILLLPFLSSLFMWGFFGGFRVGISDFRHMMLPSLISVVFVAYDYRHFPFQLGKDKMKHHLQFCLITLAFAYTWFIMEQNHSDYTLDSRIVVTQPIVTTLDLLVLLAIFTPYILSKGSSLGTHISRELADRKVAPSHSLTTKLKPSIVRILFLSAIVINLSVPTILVGRASYIISKNTWDPTYYAQARSVEVFYDDPLIEIADYYVANINNSDVTMTYSMQRLPFVSERPIVDLAWNDQVHLVLPALKSESQTEIVELLALKNIRYFLFPTSKSHRHSTFSYYSESFTLFKMVEQQRIIKANGYAVSFILLRNFYSVGYNLYEMKFLNMSDLMYNYYFEENPITISDNNQSNQWISTTPEISLSYILEQNQTVGKNAMKIEIEPYSSQTREYVQYEFLSPLDLSGNDFISFHWYGNNSLTTVTLRFLSESWENQFEFSFVDSWTGWARIIVPFQSFSVHIGSPSWTKIDKMNILFDEEIEEKTSFYVDKIIADVGIQELHIIPLSVIS